MIYTVLSIQNKKIVFLVSSFLIFVSNRFAMLHVYYFYKQLRSGDNTENWL